MILKYVMYVNEWETNACITDTYIHLQKVKKKGWGDVGWVMHAENDDDGNASVCKDSNDDN